MVCRILSAVLLAAMLAACGGDESATAGAEEELRALVTDFAALTDRVLKLSEAATDQWGKAAREVISKTPGAKSVSDAAQLAMSESWGVLKTLGRARDYMNEGKLEETRLVLAAAQEEADKADVLLDAARSAFATMKSR